MLEFETQPRGYTLPTQVFGGVAFAICAILMYFSYTSVARGSAPTRKADWLGCVLFF